eukprot:31141-Pelagococcus_subviridis.AAC.15
MGESASAALIASGEARRESNARDPRTRFRPETRPAEFASARKTSPGLRQRGSARGIDPRP